MTYLEKITGPLSNRITERAKHCSAVKIGLGIYRVTPMTLGFTKHHGKAKRRVQFGLNGNRIFVICTDFYTGQACEANDRGNACCHAVAAYWRFLRSAEKEQAHPQAA
jgi:hypothetical protein